MIKKKLSKKTSKKTSKTTLKKNRTHRAKGKEWSIELISQDEPLLVFACDYDPSGTFYTSGGFYTTGC